MSATTFNKGKHPSEILLEHAIIVDDKTISEKNFNCSQYNEAKLDYSISNIRDFISEIRVLDSDSYDCNGVKSKSYFVEVNKVRDLINFIRSERQRVIASLMLDILLEDVSIS